MPKYNDPVWWADQTDQYSQALAATVTTAYMQGVLANPYLYNWDKVKGSASDYLNAYLSTNPDLKDATLAGIMGTTEKKTKQAINIWLHGGMVGSLQKALEPTFGPERAMLIAITEATALYNKGQIDAWKSSGSVYGKMWQTADDERVCPYCGSMHGTFVSLNKGWNFTTDLAKEMGMKGAMTITQPPAHPGCRCKLLPVGNAEAPLVVDALWNPLAVMEEINKLKLIEAQKTAQKAQPPKEVNPVQVATEFIKWAKDKALVKMSPEAAYRKIYQWFDRNESFPGKHLWFGDGQGFADTEIIGAKRTIQREIADRTGLPPTSIREFIHQWAQTANDEDYRSMMIQKIAGELFGVEMSPWQKDNWEKVSKWRQAEINAGEIDTDKMALPFTYYDEVMEGVEEAGYNPESATRASIKAMYEYTQEQMRKELGEDVETIPMWRGVGGSGKSTYGKAADAGAKVNVLESWTIRREVAAEGFGVGGSVIKANIPVTDIVGSARTGFGCLDEWEFVVKKSAGILYEIEEP